MRKGKIIMAKYEEQAKTFCDAIRHFATNADAIDNMESYLSRHFCAWMEKFAYVSNTLSAEMKCFAHMFDDYSKEELSA